MALVDTLAEQAQLEALLETSKPPIPLAARDLHWLLFTPFRYPTSKYGSRFRRPYEAGVCYVAPERRTACAELGYWRWRFLCASPSLGALEMLPQTLFQVSIATRAVDLRKPPFVLDRRCFTDPADYRYCQHFAAQARLAAVEAIVYQSVRDPDSGACIALMAPSAFAKRAPIAQETWNLSVTADQVVWQKSDVLAPAAFEFAVRLWN